MSFLAKIRVLSTKGYLFNYDIKKIRFFEESITYTIVGLVFPKHISNYDDAARR